MSGQTQAVQERKAEHTDLRNEHLEQGVAFCFTRGEQVASELASEQVRKEGREGAMWPSRKQAQAEGAASAKALGGGRHGKSESPGDQCGFSEDRDITETKS